MFSKNEMNNVHQKKLFVTKNVIRNNCLEADITSSLFLNKMEENVCILNIQAVTSRTKWAIFNSLEFFKFESCIFFSLANKCFLCVFVQEEALHGFRVSDYLEYMESLEVIYRPVLLKDMRNIRVQNT